MNLDTTIFILFIDGVEEKAGRLINLMAHLEETCLYGEPSDISFIRTIPSSVRESDITAEYISEINDKLTLSERITLNSTLVDKFGDMYEV